MGAAYIVRKRARFVSINGPVNLRQRRDGAVYRVARRHTPVDAVDGFLVHNGRPLCAVTSESAHRYFARNDDGNGKARGALIGAITAKLERKDAGHQMRWDLLWSDPEAQKLRHPDHADFWLWGHAFFEADMADLEHVAGLIGARR